MLWQRYVITASSSLCHSRSYSKQWRATYSRVWLLVNSIYTVLCLFAGFYFVNSISFAFVFLPLSFWFCFCLFCNSTLLPLLPRLHLCRCEHNLTLLQEYICNILLCVNTVHYLAPLLFYTLHAVFSADILIKVCPIAIAIAIITTTSCLVDPLGLHINW